MTDVTDDECRYCKAGICAACGGKRDADKDSVVVNREMLDRLLQAERSLDAVLKTIEQATEALLEKTDEAESKQV